MEGTYPGTAVDFKGDVARIAATVLCLFALRFRRCAEDNRHAQIFVFLSIGNMVMSLGNKWMRGVAALMLILCAEDAVAGEISCSTGDSE